MKKIYKQKSLKTGFTFIEVMIATVIIGIISSCLAMSVITSFSSTHKTENISKATELASRYMETIKSNLAYASVYDANEDPPVPVTSSYTANGYYTVTVQTTNLESGIIGGITVTTLKEIDVTYKKTGDSTVLANLSTIIARPR